MGRGQCGEARGVNGQGVLVGDSGPERLLGERLHDGNRIFHAVLKFADEQALPFFEGRFLGHVIALHDDAADIAVPIAPVRSIRWSTL